jgi:phosphatidylserine decarboxylase
MSNPLSGLFYRNYQRLPHALACQLFGRLFRCRPPQPLLRAAQRLWINYGGLEMDDFEDGPFSSLEEVFLRRLKANRRPLGQGMVSPVDGQVVDAGRVDAAGTLRVKGELISFRRLVGASDEEAQLFDGGAFVVIFLSPSGYHHVHMPEDGMITQHRWIPGALFPQNFSALEHIPRVHERNARVVLHCLSDAGERFILIMVGAGAVSGIHVLGLKTPTEPRAEAEACTVRRRKGEEVGYFSLGSTVVLLTQKSAQLRASQPRARLRMGETLFKESDVEERASTPEL